MSRGKSDPNLNKQQLQRLRTIDGLMRSLSSDGGPLPNTVLEQAEGLIADMQENGHQTAVQYFSDYLEKLLKQQADNIELELRFLRPKGFIIPDDIAGMKSIGSAASNWHRDHHFDTDLQQLGGALRDADCSLRIREFKDGSLQATFKRKKSTQGALTIRQEIEDTIENFDLDQDHPALNAARQITTTPFEELFTIDNHRTDHYFASPESSLILSEDKITYPDHSKEERIELEHVHGVSLLEQCEKELHKQYKKIKKAPRGKRSEGRQRLSKKS